MPTNQRDIPLADTLGLLLPKPPTAALLQAAVLSGDRAQEAWARFCTLTPDPKAFFQGDCAGVKRHLPLLHENLVRHGITIDRTLQPILRTAALREELRAGRFRRGMHEGLTALHTDRVPFVLLKGTAVAETVYPKATLRHSHDVDMLIDDESLPRAVDALTTTGFTRRTEPLADGGVRMDHPSGLPFELHRRLIDVLPCELPRGEMVARAHLVEVMGVPTRVFDPTDALAHIIGHTLFNPRHASFAWIVDAVMLIRSHSEIDWLRLGDVLVRGGMASPAAVQLRELVDQFHVPVPPHVTGMVNDAARASSRLERTVIVDMLRHRPQRRLLQLLGVGGARSRLRVCAALLAPPAAYLRCVYGIESQTALLVWYLKRPVRFVWGQLRKGVYRVQRKLWPAPISSPQLEQVRS